MLKAGVAITDITPWEGVEMAGYPHCPRPNVGAHDPLYASALYLDNGDKKIVWVTLDILYFGKVFTRQIREKFPEYTLMLTTSHTHSGPWAATPEAYEIEEGVANNPEYIEFLMNKLEHPAYFSPLLVLLSNYRRFYHPQALASHALSWYNEA